MSQLVLPESYQKFFTKILKFTIVMAIVDLVAGVLYQESSKKIAISEALPAGAHWQATVHLALVHGHMFMMGVIIPLTVCFMLYLGQVLGYGPVGEKTLKWGGSLYIWSAISAMLLILYKGYHYNIAIRKGILDFNEIDHLFFGGQEIFRHIAYGLSHTVMVVALGMLVTGLWKTMKK